MAFLFLVNCVRRIYEQGECSDSHPYSQVIRYGVEREEKSTKDENK